jgi:hypothetical protein
MTMQVDSAITWGCIALGTALAMALVFDRDRLLRWAFVRGLVWGAFVLYVVCVR